MFPKTGIATVQLLERLGYEVDFPQAQTCCGQLHFNTGYQTEALRLARRFRTVFSDAEFVVAPSASCVAMIRDFYPYLAEQERDDALAEEFASLALRVLELTEFLAQLGVENVGASFPHRVAYHPTCHSLRALRLGDGPHRLLRAVNGLELVDLEGVDECCGFGGTFSVKNADISNTMLEDKLHAIVESGAEVVTAVDTSCLTQIGGGLSRRDLALRTMHIAEILAAGAS
jgi:L-lactate dehydrogenase complex protein LldE